MLTTFALPELFEASRDGHVALLARQRNLPLRVLSRNFLATTRTDEQMKIQEYCSIIVELRRPRALRNRELSANVQYLE